MLILNIADFLSILRVCQTFCLFICLSDCLFSYLYVICFLVCQLIRSYEQFVPVFLGAAYLCFAQSTCKHANPVREKIYFFIFILQHRRFEFLHHKLDSFDEDRKKNMSLRWGYQKKSFSLLSLTIGKMKL